MNRSALILILTTLLFSEACHGANGILELDSKPGGAEVFVDGKKKGATPETEGQKLTMELAEGDHEIVIKKEGVGSATKKVFVGEGVIQPLTMTIMPEAYTNPLGMKFVPVPGTQILMCIHETRNKDYAQYAAESRGVDSRWKGVVFELSKAKYTIKNDAEHPVVNVSWEDATAFCAWLGRKDGKTYRLPTDHEWSCAVGVGDQENARDTPEAKDCKVPGFPWGAGYPPARDRVGNYWDATVVVKGETESTDLGSYNDGYLLTAPVMSYPANKLGIYDLGGNVWEWCQDAYSPTSSSRVLRGASWINYDRSALPSSSRYNDTPGRRYNLIGFRCVVVVGSSSPSFGSGYPLPFHGKDIRLPQPDGSRCRHRSLCDWRSRGGDLLAGAFCHEGLGCVCDAAHSRGEFAANAGADLLLSAGPWLSGELSVYPDRRLGGGVCAASHAARGGGTGAGSEEGRERSQHPCIHRRASGGHLPASGPCEGLRPRGALSGG